MKMTLLCLALVLGFLLAAGGGAWAQRLEVSVATPPVVSRRVARREGVRVACCVTNRGSETVHLRCYSCSVEDNWRTSSRRILVPPHPCRANILGDYVLKPGESYRCKLELSVAPQLKVGQERFRLYFTSVKAGRRPPPTFASEELVLQVTP